MKCRLAAHLQWVACVALLVILCGCTAESFFAAPNAESLQTFFADFGRQVLTAALL